MSTSTNTHNHVIEIENSCETEQNSNYGFKHILQMLSALIIHSFIEGLPLSSLQFNSIYFYGVGIHKLVESFFAGTVIYYSDLASRTKFVLSAVFAAITPIAMIIGEYFLAHFSSYLVYLLAMSMGTMIFLVFFEMLVNLRYDNSRIINILIVFAGSIIGYIISAMHTHSHTPELEHSDSILRNLTTLAFEQFPTTTS
jgi:zinc transporter ZupT